MSRNNIKQLFDPNVAMYVLGYLMAQPQTLFKERCMLTLNDFPNQLYQIIFGAVNNLASGGATYIHPQDVDLYLAQYAEQYKIFSNDHGLNLLKQMDQMDLGHDEGQFYIHYEKLKKFTVLRDLEKANIDTSEFYDTNVNLLNIEEESIKLDSFTIPQILDKIRLKLANIEKVNFNKDGSYFQDASEGIDELLAQFQEEPDVGYPLDGEITNYICRGGRRGKMYLFSAPSGTGKTRFMVGQACNRAYPRIVDGKVVIPSGLERVYYLATEQEPSEIQTMILAYISGVNESKIKYGNATIQEKSLLQQAAQIMKKYKGNFYLDRVPEPSINKVRTSIVEKILEKDVGMVVYDYIAIPEDDDGTATKRQLRSDQVLMQFSNTLKEIAVSYNVFMLSGTQITGNDLSKKMVRGFADIRDGKSIADKADFCMIGCFLTPDEFRNIETFVKELSLPEPNYVIDVYKNRDGLHTNCKIFKKFDLGTLRVEDLLITTQSFKLINDCGKIEYGSQEIVDVLDFLTRGGETA